MWLRRRPVIIPSMATILVAEDGDDAAELVVKTLRKAGHRVLSVANGHEALAVLLLGNVDLLVTDLRMPGMDGATLLSALRSGDRFRPLPVIVFSAYADGHCAQELRDAGVREVFRKADADLADLVAAVDRHVKPPQDVGGTV